MKNFLKFLAVLAASALLFGTPALAQNATKVTIVGNGGGSPTVTNSRLDVNISGAGATVTATQGNAGTNAQAWWVQIGDATNGPVAVKAPSTAPVATDKSLVTTTSPNSVEGALADAAATVGSTGSLSAKLRLITTQLDTISSNTAGSVPAGTNLIGSVNLAPSATSTYGVAFTSSSALAANTVIKASAGNLYSLEIAADSTLSAAPWWVMVYNATSAPGDGAVTPAKCYALLANQTQLSLAFLYPIAFSTGITVGVSTTGCFTKTASTHAFISGDAQ